MARDRELVGGARGIGLAVAEEVQRVVKEAVQNMTGKLVSKVNVIIASVEDDEPESSDAPCETEE